ncbi:unnamed protein product [Caenorhabditis sp. 36 PRJEB53466]|nr:unnamed protein product [Caenorhabditis sp. 36 PRJEB53466]
MSLNHSVSLGHLSELSSKHSERLQLVIENNTFVKRLNEFHKMASFIEVSLKNPILHDWVQLSDMLQECHDHVTKLTFEDFPYARDPVAMMKVNQKLQNLHDTVATMQAFIDGMIEK